MIAVMFFLLDELAWVDEGEPGTEEGDFVEGEGAGKDREEEVGKDGEEEVEFAKEEVEIARLLFLVSQRRRVTMVASGCELLLVTSHTLCQGKAETV
jgi:hypothetical protein